MRAEQSKPFKGKSMEGWIARWYAKTRGKDMQDFRRAAQAAAKRLAPGCSALEVAPGPGFFSIELAKAGDFQITGLDISRTFVRIAARNARDAGVKVAFRLGDVTAMPFADDSFDFIYCSAAFKNFTDPVRALDEMSRVLRPGGAAVIVDLRKDVSLADIDSYVKHSGRSRIDAWITSLTFRFMLIKRAYSQDEFGRLAAQSRFGSCEMKLDEIGFEARFVKPAYVAAGAS